MSYNDFLAAAVAGKARTVFEDGSTYAVYLTPAGTTEYWHFCYGDHRVSYAENGFELNGEIIRVPARDDCAAVCGR